MSMIGFLKNNRYKRLSLEAFCYAGWYRLCILLVKPKYLQKNWGEEGRESPEEETREHYLQAARIGQIVDRYCSKTAWESKCLVRALTARKLLQKRKIHSTLYLGCGRKEGKMVAHAWLRCGKMFVTGGNGEGYAVVDKFYI